MKTRLKNFILLVFIGLMVAGCSKDMNDEPSLLGSWIEEAPQENRTELFFVDYSRVFKSDTTGTAEEYKYRLEGDSIYFGEENNEESYFFKKIDENRFQIENLYAADTLEEITYMIFERNL